MLSFLCFVDFFNFFLSSLSLPFHFFLPSFLFFSFYLSFFLSFFLSFLSLPFLFLSFLPFSSFISFFLFFSFFLSLFPLFCLSLFLSFFLNTFCVFLSFSQLAFLCPSFFLSVSSYYLLFNSSFLISVYSYFCFLLIFIVRPFLLTKCSFQTVFDPYFQSCSYQKTEYHHPPPPPPPLLHSFVVSFSSFLCFSLYIFFVTDLFSPCYLFFILSNRIPYSLIRKLMGGGGGLTLPCHATPPTRHPG